MRSSEHDWVEVLAKAVLPRTPRVWIRRRRHKSFFQRHLRSSDVFLVGHPKSGNTWLAYMLAIVLFQDSRNRITLANLKNYIPYIHGRDIRIAEYAHLSDPRIFRDEYPIHQNLDPKTIYLIRDPRAVLVSLFHMYRIEFDDSRMTLRCFLDDYLASQGCFRTWNNNLVRWDRQALAWTERAAQDGGVLMVRYEDMVRNRRDILEHVAAFAGIPKSEEHLMLADARGSFEAMQAAEDEHGAEAYPGEIALRGRFIRRGKIDGWRQEMDKDLVERIEQEFAPAMRATGYLF
jgi:hypothetical protein